MGIRILVYGWYGKANLGDEAFKDCFRHLWPEADFIFSSMIPPNINSNYNLLWIGGGSFLEQPISGLEDVTIPVAFIGVGGCSCPAPSTRMQLERANLIVFRDARALAHWPSPKAHAISDLVFAREFKPLEFPKKDQVVVFLNDFISPRAKGPEWKALAYNWFIQEFTKILDRFSCKYRIKLFPMCVNDMVDDRRTAAAIMGRSEYPHRYDWVMDRQTEWDLRAAINESQFVITQRFHGLVYSMIENTPCVTMTMHDKFASLCDELDIPVLDFYGLTDRRFTNVLDKVRYREFVTPKMAEYMEDKKAEWKKMAEFISAEFGL